MTKRWDQHRAIIVSFYKQHNKPLHEVKRLMAEQYGFVASYVPLLLNSEAPSLLTLDSNPGCERTDPGSTGGEFASTSVADNGARPQTVAWEAVHGPTTMLASVQSLRRTTALSLI